jgi:hypothetical protein
MNRTRFRFQDSACVNFDFLDMSVDVEDQTATTQASTSVKRKRVSRACDECHRVSAKVTSNPRLCGTVQRADIPFSLQCQVDEGSTSCRRCQSSAERVCTFDRPAKKRGVSRLKEALSGDKTKADCILYSLAQALHLV